MSAQHEPLATAQAIAVLLGVSSKWVYSACRLYDLPYYQVGRYKRFSPSQVFEWLEESGPMTPGHPIGGAHGVHHL